jgi:catechol 2,3-dioxygenase-like lactoylglutathione lyase family enzyme
MKTVSTLQTGHVGLNVTNLARALDFYRDVFEFEVMGESDTPGREFVFLGRDGRLLLTLWLQSTGAFEPGTPGLHHLSFQVESIDEIEAAEARLRERGATIHHGGIVPHSEGAPSGGLYFEDPDGIRLEIYAPEGVGERAAPSGDAPTCGFF